MKKIGFASDLESTLPTDHTHTSQKASYYYLLLDLPIVLLAVPSIHQSI